MQLGRRKAAIKFKKSEEMDILRKTLNATAYVSPLMIGLSAFIVSKYKLLSKRRNIKSMNPKEKIATATAVSLTLVAAVSVVSFVSSQTRKTTEKTQQNNSIEQNNSSDNAVVMEIEEEEPERRVFKSQLSKRQTQTKSHDPIAHTNSTHLEDSPDRTRSYSMEAHIPEKIDHPGQIAKTRKGIAKPHDRSKHSYATKLEDSPDATRSNSLHGHDPEHVESPGKAITRLKMNENRAHDHRSKHSHSAHVEDSPGLHTFDSTNHHPDSIDHHTPGSVGVSPSQKQARHGPVLHSEKRNMSLERGPVNLSESLGTRADHSTSRTIPARRRPKENYNFVEDIPENEKKNTSVPLEKDEENTRSLSPFSESAMSLAEEAWRAFEKKTQSPSKKSKDEEQILSDDSLGSDDDSGRSNKNYTEETNIHLKERVLPKRKVEREKEEEILNSKLREVNDAVKSELQDRCNLVEVDVINRVIRLKKKIKFVKNTVVVKRESHRVLQQAATALKTIRAVIDRLGSEFGVQQLRFECAGHTHAKTPDVAESALHMRVSESRANAIREFLIDQGVSEMYIVAKGYGGTVPIGKKPSQNRRVEINVLATSPMFMSF